MQHTTHKLFSWLCPWQLTCNSRSLIRHAVIVYLIVLIFLLTVWKAWSSFNQASKFWTAARNLEPHIIVPLFFRFLKVPHSGCALQSFHSCKLLFHKQRFQGSKERFFAMVQITRLKILTSDAVSSLIRIYSQSWGGRWCFEHHLSFAATWLSCAFDRGCPLCSCFGFNFKRLHYDAVLLHLRLIGIFWVRRRNLSRLPCVQSIVP